MSNEIERNLYLARVTEQSERYEETVKYMEDIVKNKGQDLSVEERNLLSVAFKNCVSSRRSAWRSVYAIEMKEKSTNSKFLQCAKKFEPIFITFTNGNRSIFFKL